MKLNSKDARQPSQEFILSGIERLSAGFGFWIRKGGSNEGSNLGS
jgi:hypothetical protein